MNGRIKNSMGWLLSLGGRDEDRFRHVRRLYDREDAQYEASMKIDAAVDTAVALGKPLLVSGEPGVGKTELAKYVARRFGLLDRDGQPEVLRFDIKSTTKGSELIYRYDAIRHFREANRDRQGPQAGGPARMPARNWQSASYRRYIELEALGTALALGKGPHDYGNDDLNRIVASALAPLPNTDAARISVVLIDEIDKAPRDVPNDLLREIDEMVAPIPELGPNVRLERPDTDHRPIVIITTNDERTLPDAFLRRCCFLHIPFPDADDDADLRDIIRTRLGEVWRADGLAGASITLVHRLREKSARISKRPTTAELIEFIAHNAGLGTPYETDFWASDDFEIRRRAQTSALAIFAKSADDERRICELLPREKPRDGK